MLTTLDKVKNCKSLIFFSNFLLQETRAFILLYIFLWNKWWKKKNKEVGLLVVGKTPENKGDLLVMAN